MSIPEDGRRGVPLGDPIASANLYAAGRLDEAYGGVVAPLQERLAAWRVEGAYLWTMRYAKGGEHLKLRVHAPAEREREAHAHVAAVCEEWLSRLPPRDDGPPRHSRPDAPPIDVEDRVQEDHADRTWIPTTYVASQVALGGEPFLAQPDYRARLTRALASGCEVVLAALEDGGSLSHAQRQRTLLQALIVGLAGAGLDRDRAARYLVYHRDWLIRFPLLKRGGDPAAAGRALARIEEQAERMTPLGEALRTLVDDTWEADLGDAGGGGLGVPAEVWSRALARVVEHAERFSGDADFRIDPFADDVAFPPLFKAIHGLGNQLGLRGLDEALAHHLVLRAVLHDVSPPLSIDLIPGERGGAPADRS